MKLNEREQAFWDDSVRGGSDRRNLTGADLTGAPRRPCERPLRRVMSTLLKW